jgi:tetratricopeptide (TPR) repeat protein
MDYIPALINRAVSLREMAQFEQAESDLTRAIELEAPQSRVYLLRADIRDHLGDPAGAAADREQGLRLTPSDELSWIARGLARLREAPEQSLLDFQMATRLNPRSYAAWRNIAHVYAERLNRPQDAIAVLNGLLEWSDRPATDLVSRGVLLARLGQRDKAHHDARRVLTLSPAAKEQFQVACIYALTSGPDNDDADVALALVEKAIAIEPRWLPYALKDADLAKLRAHRDFARTIAQLSERMRREQRLTHEFQ